MDLCWNNFGNPGILYIHWTFHYHKIITLEYGCCLELCFVLFFVVLFIVLSVTRINKAQVWEIYLWYICIIVKSFVSLHTYQNAKMYTYTSQYHEFYLQVNKYFPMYFIIYLSHKFNPLLTWERIFDSSRRWNCLTSTCWCIRQWHSWTIPFLLPSASRYAVKSMIPEKEGLDVPMFWVYLKWNTLNSSSHR